MYQIALPLTLTAGRSANASRVPRRRQGDQHEAVRLRHGRRTRSTGARGVIGGSTTGSAGNAVNGARIGGATTGSTGGRQELCRAGDRDRDGRESNRVEFRSRRQTRYSIIGFVAAVVGSAVEDLQDRLPHQHRERRRAGHRPERPAPTETCSSWAGATARGRRRRPRRPERPKRCARASAASSQGRPEGDDRRPSRSGLPRHRSGRIHASPGSVVGRRRRPAVPVEAEACPMQ